MSIIGCHQSTFGIEMEPAPAVQAYCFLDRLGKGFWVTFLIDTGAAGTCLHGAPAYNIQQDMRPETIEIASGVGGTGEYYGERATLVFSDNKKKAISRTLNRIDIQKITLRDIVANHGVPKTPSLIGRDILNRWKLTYDCPGGVICLTTP